MSVFFQDASMMNGRRTEFKSTLKKRFYEEEIV